MREYEDVELRSEERYADVWGLTSLLIGGLLALGSPIMLIFNILLIVHSARVVPAQNARFLYYCGFVAMGVLWLSCLVSLFFGIKAWRAAAATGQPAGLAVGGTLASLFALGAWLFVGIDLIVILGFYAGL
jgi:hypothetical protein